MQETGYLGSSSHIENGSILHSMTKFQHKVADNMSDQPGSSRQDPMTIVGSQESQSRPRDRVSSRDLDNLIAGLMGSQRAPTVDPSHRPEPPRIPFPHRTNVVQVTPSPNPDDPIQTAFQRKMLDAFKAEGRWGLVCAVYEEAKEQQRSTATKGPTWDCLIEDHENEHRYMFQLACMLPDEVIVSLIRNTLPSDYMSNSSKNLKSFVDHSMNLATPCAGIYLSTTTRADQIGYMQSPSQQPSAKLMGKWLSSNEVAQMLYRVEMYILEWKTDWENTALDNQTTTATSRIEAWVAETRRLYCTNIAPAHADKFFLRCPSEVGFAGNITERLAEHVDNAKTTPIFGLVNTITQQPASQRGFDFPAPWGVVLWPLWLRDPTLVHVAEAFGRVLCSAYWHEGGFNFHEASDSTVLTTIPGYEDQVWSNSIKAAGKRIDELQSLDVELKRAAARAAQVDCLLRLPKSKASHDEAQKKADEGAKKLEDARLALREKESKIRDLEQEVETERQGIRSMTEYIQGDYVAELLKADDDFNKVMDEREGEVREIRLWTRKIGLTICSCHRGGIECIRAIKKGGRRHWPVRRGKIMTLPRVSEQSLLS